MGINNNKPRATQFLRHCRRLSLRTAPCLIIAIFVCGGVVPTFAQEIGTVNGQVVHEGIRKPVVGAVVQVKDTQIKAVSGAAGRYVLLNVPSGLQTLVVNYLGTPEVEVSVTVGAGETTRRSIELGSHDDTMEHLLVKGAATGRARALNMQRSAKNIMNIVSADSIGNFPDQNVAEALGRVPGITIVRNRGEGRFVNIRGIDAELNAYSIDGLSLAAPGDDERAIALDLIPSDVVERLEVNKTLLPDQPADAVGGAVNVISQSAFDHAGTLARLALQSNYSDLSEAWQPHIDGAFGKVFGEVGQLGLLVAFSHDRRELSTERQSNRSWDLEQDPVTGSEYYLPGRTRQTQYEVERKRTGATVNLEYRRDDESLYFFRGAYNEFSDHGFRHRSEFEFDADGLLSLTNDSATVNIGDVDEFGETEIKQVLRDRFEELTISAFSAGGENRIGDMLLDYQLGYSFAEEDNKYRLESTYVLSDATQVAYTGSAALSQNIRYTGVGIDPTDPANYVFDEITDNPSVIEEDHWEFAINTRRDFNTEHPSFLKTGFRGRLKDKKSENEEFESNANPASVDTLDQITSGTGTQTYNGSVPLIDPRIRQIVNQQMEAFDIERIFVDSTAQDWQSKEDVYAAYIMGGYDFGKLDVQGGVRLERTEFETYGFSIDEESGSVTPVSATNNYNDWLPGIHAEYAFSDDLVLRAAYTQTVSRPGFVQSSAASVTDGDEIERGNPNLNRARSRNIDLSLEMFLPDSLGLIAVWGFYKDVDDYVFERVFIEDIGGEAFEITSYDNGESGEIYGVEFAYQQEFAFLPSPFDGVGVQANLVFVGSEALLPVSEERISAFEREIDFPRQSDRVGNLALTYEKGGFFFRVAATHQSGYLVSVGDEHGEDVITEDRVHWDFTSRYAINERWRVFANFRNLTDEPDGQRFRGSNRASSYESFSWSAQVGVDFKL